VTDAANMTAALVGFARLLRGRGMRASPAQISRLQAAIGVLPSDKIAYLYWAGRTCLAVPQASVPAYDVVFAQYFLGATGGPTEQEATCRQAIRPDSPDEQRSPAEAAPLVWEPDGGNEDDEAKQGRRLGSAASSIELLRITPFAACTADELDIVAALVRRLRVRPPDRRSLRLKPGHRKVSLDLRTTARWAMKTQAEFLILAWRQRRTRPRRVVLLLDVSRSMAPFSRLYLHFAYALATAWDGAEVICFGTQLTRITGLLRSRQAARTLEQVAMSVLDWNGGTRIADAVAGLRGMRATQGALRRATVIIFSDGLEQGDPADLGRQIRLLRRTCREIIWVNPQAGDDGYRPLTGGMRAALPSVDVLMPGHTLVALEDVASALSTRRTPARVPARSHALQ
jgi:uncharacterized protein with von Willebrand factor type A (vWA) domain